MSGGKTAVRLVLAILVVTSGFAGTAAAGPVNTCTDEDVFVMFVTIGIVNEHCVQNMNAQGSTPTQIQYSAHSSTVNQQERAGRRYTEFKSNINDSIGTYNQIITTQAALARDDGDSTATAKTNARVELDNYTAGQQRAILNYMSNTAAGIQSLEQDVQSAEGIQLSDFMHSEVDSSAGDESVDDFVIRNVNVTSYDGETHTYKVAYAYYNVSNPDDGVQNVYQLLTPLGLKDSYESSYYSDEGIGPSPRHSNITGVDFSQSDYKLVLGNVNVDSPDGSTAQLGAAQYADSYSYFDAVRSETFSHIDPLVDGLYQQYESGKVPDELKFDPAAEQRKRASNYLSSGSNVYLLSLAATQGMSVNASSTFTMDYTPTEYAHVGGPSSDIVGGIGGEVEFNQDVVRIDNQDTTSGDSDTVSTVTREFEFKQPAQASVEITKLNGTATITFYNSGSAETVDVNSTGTYTYSNLTKTGNEIEIKAGASSTVEIDHFGWVGGDVTRKLSGGIVADEGAFPNSTIQSGVQYDGGELSGDAEMLHQRTEKTERVPLEGLFTVTYISDGDGNETDSATFTANSFSSSSPEDYEKAFDEYDQQREQFDQRIDSQGGSLTTGGLLDDILGSVGLSNVPIELVGAGVLIAGAVVVLLLGGGGSGGTVAVTLNQLRKRRRK